MKLLTTPLTKSLITSLILIMLTSCGISPYRDIKPDEIIDYKRVSYKAPSAPGWEFPKAYDKATWEPRKYEPYLTNWAVNEATYDLSVVTQHPTSIKTSVLFDKNADRKAYYIENEKFDANDKETGLNYQKYWTTYILGMKCLGYVYARNHNTNKPLAGIKHYINLCGYYSTTETKRDAQRFLKVRYKYIPAGSESRRIKNITLKQVENRIKQTVADVVKTIVIKDFDKERMQREGLLYEGREYIAGDY